jgi:CHASE2 domain-containing sensor protein
VENEEIEMNTDTASSVIDRIERSRRLFNFAIAGAAMLEVMLIGAMLLIVNFADKTQALIFVGTLGSYTLLAIGLIMLALHVDRALLRAVQVGGRA